MTAPQTLSNTPQAHTESLHLHCGNNAEVLKQYPDCHFDAIVTDPPYGIEFLGKEWDNHTGAVETWQQCFRVLKPGGHLLAFSAARTYHHLATNIESVGFEIRDQLMWIYSSGFPKAQDVGKSIQRRLGVKQSISLEEYEKIKGYSNLPKGSQTFGHNSDIGTAGAGLSGRITQCTDPQAQQWEGWKTALKPGHEPIVMARKPMKGSTIDCVLKHGVGALNIDATRIPFVSAQDQSEFAAGFQHPNLQKTGGPTFQGTDLPQGGGNGFSRLEFGEKEPIKYKNQKADNLKGMIRHTGSDHNTFARINPEDRAAKDHKRVVRAGRHPGARLGDLETQTTPADHNHEETPVYEPNPQGRYPSNVLGDIPDYQKYFYCPKVSRRERHCGFEQDNLPKRLMPMPGANGLKDIRDCYDKDWAEHKKDLGKKTDSLSHIPVLSNYSQGDVKNHPLWDPSIGTNLQRLKHKIMEHNKDLGKKTDSLAHLPTESSMLAAVGGYYVDDQGRRTETAGKNIWTPTTGMVYVHGLTKIYEAWCQTHNKTSVVGNNHPTVKPVALMRYLIQLVTPANSKVLDPFMGSGSTGMAARELGHTFVGIDLDPAYVSIAQKRIEGWVRTETKKSDQSETAANSSPTDLWADLFE